MWMTHLWLSSGSAGGRGDLCERSTTYLQLAGFASCPILQISPHESGAADEEQGEGEDHTQAVVVQREVVQEAPLRQQQPEEEGGEEVVADLREHVVGPLVVGLDLVEERDAHDREDQSSDDPDDRVAE